MRRALSGRCRPGGCRWRARRRGSAAAGRAGALLAAVLVAAGVAGAGAEPPRRIVSLAPSVTETLFALGIGDRVVAVSDFCDHPPAVRGLPKIGSFLNPSIEAVLAARPDLVIGTESPGNRRAVTTLQELGVRVEIVRPARLSDVAPITRRIAALTGTVEAGERVVGRIERKLAAVRARVRAAPRRRVLMVVGQQPLIAVGHSTFLGELLEQARAINVAPRRGPWPHLNVEHVIAADPEIIIDSSMGTETATASLAYWQQFASLTAVRDARVHPFHSFSALRPGPRLPEAFEALARLLHPEQWP